MNINLNRENLRKKTSQTLAQRFGFSDPDLTSPKHDALLIWLDENIENILRKRIGEIERKFYKREFKSSYPHIVDKEELDKFNLTGLDQSPLENTVFQFDKIWEQPVLNGNYTVGFCDMKVDLSISRKNAKVYLSTQNHNIDEISQYYEEYIHWFEIKPEIRSLGELIRQLRMYQSYTEGTWYVVSPDIRFKSMIEGQGFYFIEAPKEILSNGNTNQQ